MQAKLMTSVSVLTIAMTLFFLGVLFIAFTNIGIWFQKTSQKASVVLYLDEVTAKDSMRCLDIISQLKGFQEVISVGFVSKSDAWRKFETLYGVQMLTAVEKNPFPASFEVVIDSKYMTPEALTFLKTKCVSIPGIEDVQFSDTWMEFLRKARRIIVMVSLVTVPMVVIGLQVLISNTIKLTIYARKDLIINMGYVGASNFFIKTPFVMEGILQGVIGGGFGIGILWVLKYLLARQSLYWGTWYFFPALFFIGVFFGWLGSMNAVRKFLKPRS